MNKLHIHERICTPCSKRVRKCLRTHLHMHGAHNTCLDSCILSAKNAHAPVHARLCNGAVASLPWKLFRSQVIFSLARALSRLSFATHPPAVSTKAVTRRCSLKKSAQIHASSCCGRRCGVAQASFDHLRWCRPHPVCLWVALEAWPRSSPITEIYFHHFFSRASQYT